jgi:hypothetical protein
MTLLGSSLKSKNNEEIKSSLSNEDAKESNEPDYDEDKDQLEEQEEKAGETTINQVF